MDKIIVPEVKCNICKEGILLPFSEFLGHNAFTSATASIGYYNCSKCGCRFNNGKYYRWITKTRDDGYSTPWSKEKTITSYKCWDEIKNVV
jgi:hypothetical protein